MNKSIITGLMTLALGLCLSAGAIAGQHKGKHDGVCPSMTLKHASDLNLSKKQVTELKKIKAQMMTAMEKGSKDAAAVLNANQIKKYNDIAGHVCPMCERCTKCDKKHKGECCKKDAATCDHKKKDGSKKECKHKK